MWCESFLEMRYALLLEYDEFVKGYATQPEYFDVYGRRYTPDFLVDYKSGYSDYIEVKHTTFMDDEFFRKHELRKEVIYARTKLNLILVSELDIKPTVTANYELLKSFRQLEVDSLIPEIQRLPKTLPFSRLEKFVSKIAGFTRAHAWALVAHQYFHFNVTEPFGTDTKLMRA